MNLGHFSVYVYKENKVQSEEQHINMWNRKPNIYF